MKLYDYTNRSKNFVSESKYLIYLDILIKNININKNFVNL